MVEIVKMQYDLDNNIPKITKYHCWQLLLNRLFTLSTQISRNHSKISKTLTF